jgi:hypothetical protein
VSSRPRSRPRRKLRTIDKNSVKTDARLNCLSNYFGNNKQAPSHRVNDLGDGNNA